MIVYFQRRPRKGNFSIERVFSIVRNAIQPGVSWKVWEAPHFSSGVYSRAALALKAMKSQGTVNHVTGDIQFLAIFLSSRKTILTVHDIGAMTTLTGIKKFIFKWFWIVFPIRRARLVTTISEATRNDIISYFPAASPKISVIYNPLPPGFARAPRAFNAVNPTILQIGTKPNKNLFNLINALEGIPCSLVVIGVLSEAQRAALAKSKISYVSLTGITNEEMIQKYRECDIVSLISLYEGFGMPIIEANAVGRAVITSNVSSMPEVAADAAHLVDPRDRAAIRAGILRLIGDESYRNQLVENGYRNCARFDPDRICRQYMRLYRMISANL